MNDARRKELDKATTLLWDAQQIINEVQEEEQDAFDNLPEGLQQSEKGETLEENADELQEISDTIEEMIDKLTDLILGG